MLAVIADVNYCLLHWMGESRVLDRKDLHSAGLDILSTRNQVPSYVKD